MKSSASTLGDFVSLQRGTTYKGMLLNAPGPFLLGLASIERDGGFRADNLKTYGGESPEALLLRPGDLYVSLKDVTQSGDLLGSVARVPNSIPLGRLTQDTVKLRARSGAPPASYLYWLLRTPEYRAHCRTHATGTTNLGLSREDFLAFQVPPINRMRELIYESLDQIEAKIEQNRRTAQALERLAQAIFRAWFVDFEPVKAKAEGATAFPGMPQPVFDALPTHFVDSDIGPVPKGWQVKAIGDVVTAKGGGTPSTKNPEYWDGGEHCWATPKDMSRLTHPVLLDTERRITDAGVNSISSGILPVGTVLMSSRAPVGYLAIAGVPTAINQGFIAMVCDGPLPPTYILNWAFTSLDAIKAHASGTTFPEISKRNFRPLPVALPTPDVIAAYQQAADPLFDLLTACVKEDEQIKKARDYLLPKLLSGSVRAEPAHG